jgi:hypothetical protein
MIDPVTALATATAAFNAVKKGVEMGQDIENMAGAIGKWMGAVSDIDKSGEYAAKTNYISYSRATGMARTC